MRRLGAALQQAEKERAAALRTASRDLELIAAVPPAQQPAAAADRRASSSGSPPFGAANRYSASPGFPHQPPAASYAAPGHTAQLPAQHRWSSHQAEPAAATSFAWASGGPQATLDPRASPQQQPCAAGPPSWQRQQRQQHVWQEAAEQREEAGYLAGGGSQYGGAPSERYGRYAAATADSDAGSVAGYGAAAHRPPTAQQWAWEDQGGSGDRRSGAATPPCQPQRQQTQGASAEALAGQLGGLTLHTPTASASSPFATDDTLQARRGKLLQSRRLCAHPALHAPPLEQAYAATRAHHGRPSHSLCSRLLPPAPIRRTCWRARRPWRTPCWR